MIIRIRQSEVHVRRWWRYNKIARITNAIFSTAWLLLISHFRAEENDNLWDTSAQALQRRHCSCDELLLTTIWNNTGTQIMVVTLWCYWPGGDDLRWAMSKTEPRRSRLFWLNNYKWFYFFCCFRLHNKVFSHSIFFFFVNYLSTNATKEEI